MNDGKFDAICTYIRKDCSLEKLSLPKYLASYSFLLVSLSLSLSLSLSHTLAAFIFLLWYTPSHTMRFLKQQSMCGENASGQIIVGQETVRPELAKFCRFGKIFKVLGNFLRVFFLSGKILDWLWQILYAIGQVFIDVNDRMLINNLAIWSHWPGNTKMWNGKR